MSENQWKRIEASKRVTRGEWTAREGAAAVGFSERQFRRVRKKVKERGASRNPSTRSPEVSGTALVSQELATS